MLMNNELGKICMAQAGYLLDSHLVGPSGSA
jgi:hypothetical protein